MNRILKERNVLRRRVAKFCANFSRKRKFRFSLLSDTYIIITSMPTCATNYFRSFDGGSVRIKGVKTLYFSGAGTFPQFSNGHRNLFCYPRPSCLLRERQLMYQEDHSGFRSTLGVSTVEALMRISINGFSPEQYHSIITDEDKRTKKSERIFVHFRNVCVWLVKHLFWLVDQTCH